MCLCLWSYLAEFSLECEKFQTEVVEKIKTLFMFSGFFFSFENLAVYETTWKNMVDADRPQVTRRNMRSVCWITKATYMIPTAFPRQVWFRKLASVLRLYLYCVYGLSIWNTWYETWSTRKSDTHFLALQLCEQRYTCCFVFMSGIPWLYPRFKTPR